MNGRDLWLRFARALGALLGYGCLAGFLVLISLQIYRWFREGEWTRFGISDGLRAGLVRCCVKDGDNGHLGSLLHWIDTPVDWLGMHKVLEVVPASLALFAVSITGNCLYNYCSDRIEERVVSDEPAPARDEQPKNAQ